MTNLFYVDGVVAKPFPIAVTLAVAWLAGWLGFIVYVAVSLT
jgi:hypothetical protein